MVGMWYEIYKNTKCYVFSIDYGHFLAERVGVKLTIFSHST